MRDKFFKSKPVAKDAATSLASVARTTSSDLVERRRDPRPLPLPEVVEVDSDSAWAAFHGGGSSTDETLAPSASNRDFDATMYVDTVPSADTQPAELRRPTEFVSTYERVMQEIESEQQEIERMRKFPKR
jgi:hypothetical protein